MRRLPSRPVAIEPAYHGEGATWAPRAVGCSGWTSPRAWSAGGRHSGRRLVRDGSRPRRRHRRVRRPAAAGGWLLGCDGGFTHLAADGDARVLIDLAGEGGDPDHGGTRMNDGGCDRAGRFFAGTMAFDKRAGAGALYRLDLDGTVTTVLDDLTISNGMGWAPDDRTVYLADSGPGLVWAFDYDLGSGTFSRQRVLLDFSRQDGVADGLTVDDEGCLWTALWGGGQVRRWSPEGDGNWSPRTLTRRLVKPCATCQQGKVNLALADCNNAVQRGSTGQHRYGRGAARREFKAAKTDLEEAVRLDDKFAAAASMPRLAPRCLSRRRSARRQESSHPRHPRGRLDRWQLQLR